MERHLGLSHYVIRRVWHPSRNTVEVICGFRGPEAYSKPCMHRVIVHR